MKTDLDSSMASPPPPPPPPSQLSMAGSSVGPSLLTVLAILVAVAALAVSIHLLLRLLSHHRRRRRSAISAAPPQPPPPLSSCETTNAKPSVADLLPLFTLSSALARRPKSSPDCAVCQSPFLPSDQLRLLPACRHAFHAQCIDPWLRSSPSPTCPLCRAAVAAPPPPSGAAPRSGSFRVEFGRVSSRRNQPPKESRNPNPNPATAPARAYDLGPSFEYLVDEEVEAVVEQIFRLPDKMPGDGSGSGAGGRPARLRDYMDRLARSASSLRFSGRWSHRFEDSGGGGASAGVWDLEGSGRREAEESGLYGLYRWLVGAY